jgi:hypothetical protein
LSQERSHGLSTTLRSRSFGVQYSHPIADAKWPFIIENFCSVGGKADRTHGDESVLRGFLLEFGIGLQQVPVLATSQHVDEPRIKLGSARVEPRMASPRSADGSCRRWRCACRAMPQHPRWFRKLVWPRDDNHDGPLQPDSATNKGAPWPRDRVTNWRSVPSAERVVLAIRSRKRCRPLPAG